MNVMNGTLLELLDCQMPSSFKALELDYSVEDYYNISRNFEDF